MSWRRFNFRQGTTLSGMRPLGSCSTQKPAPCPVVVIDEDDDGEDGSDSEVFIIDGAAGAPNPATAAADGRKTRKGDGSTGDVIDIDDDDEEEIKMGTGPDTAGPSTSRAAGSPAAMTPGRGSPRNRYGLGCTSESSDSDLFEGWDSDLDDSGTSDCEILDDMSGTARKMWETAASRKKTPHGIIESIEGRDTASTSGAGFGAQPTENVEGLFGGECHLDENIFRYFQDAWKEDAQNSSGCAKDGPAECNQNGKIHFSDVCEDGEQNGTGSSKVGPAECHEKVFQYFSDGCKEGAPNSAGSTKDCHGPSTAPNSNVCSDGNVSNRKETDRGAGSTLDPDKACNDKVAHSHDGPVPEKVPEGMQSPCLDGTFVYRFVPVNRVFPASSSADAKDGSPPLSVSTPEKSDEKVPEGACSEKDQSPSDAYNVIEKDVYSTQNDVSVSGRQAEVPPFASIYNCSRQYGETCSKKDLVDNPEESGRSMSVEDPSDFQDGLIGDREKHKESAEYKRAEEEEWASRHLQLQIQAEEAQKLRKRKKAEALRLLDMEKRQKQRLQEVRESQRKNEEEIQLKEQYRVVVRKELEDTEMRYRDMASILRVLGIPVEGGEVKAAYKQALLKFHPDRVSRNDIYQQVKAEETFKFISRLKEKLPRFL